MRNLLYGRRITADTPFQMKGPAAGHVLPADGVRSDWLVCTRHLEQLCQRRHAAATYLSCEENVTPYFIAKSGNIPRLLARYGVDAKSWAIAGMSPSLMPTFIRTNRTATAG